MKRFFERLKDFQATREPHLSQARYLHHFLVVAGVFMLFQDLLANMLEKNALMLLMVKYVDEVVPAIIFLLLVISRVAQRRNLYRTPSDIPLVFFFIVAIVSSLVHQVGTFVMAAQTIIYLKAFLVFYIFYNLPISQRMFKSYLKIFFWVGIFFLASGLVDLMFPLAFRKITGNIEYVEYRYGIPSVKSFFIHPGVFGWFMSFLALFCFAFAMVRLKSSYLLAGLLFSLGCFLSMRARSLLGLLGGLLFGLLFLSGKKRLVILALLIPLLILGVIFMGDAMTDLFQSKMTVYVSAQDPLKVARNALYLKSLEVAADYFPFGAGLGRYGSYLSSVFFSPVYDLYGLSNIHGMTRDNPAFITDTFWPMILGETGYIGLALYLFVLVIFIKMLVNHIKNTENPEWKAFHLGAFMVVVKGIIESIADPIFTAPPQALFILGVVGISSVMYRLYAEKQAPDGIGKKLKKPDPE